MDGYKPADFAQPPKSQKRPQQRIAGRVLLGLAGLVIVALASGIVWFRCSSEVC